MTVKKARKEAEKYAIKWEKEQKNLYENEKADESSGDVEYSFEYIVNKLWFPLIVEYSERKPKTIQSYKYLAEKICFYFKDRDIRSITPLDIQKYLLYLRTDCNNKNKKPLSKKTIRHHYCVLSLIFGFAIDNEIIVKNPIVKVKTPKLENKKVDAFTKEEAKKLLFFLQECDIEFQCILLFMLTLGLRRGEVIGLQWADIDLIRGVVSINRSVTNVHGKGIYVDAPKTENSIRVLPIPRMLLGLLDEYKKDKCQGEKETDYLFSGESGYDTPRDPDAITRRVKRFMARCGLPDMSPHDLRHSCATLLLQSGADIKSVQEIMGHADASTTLKYYVRTDIEQMRKATELLDL